MEQRKLNRVGDERARVGNKIQGRTAMLRISYENLLKHKFPEREAYVDIRSIEM